MYESNVSPLIFSLWVDLIFKTGALTPFSIFLVETNTRASSHKLLFIKLFRSPAPPSTMSDSVVNVELQPRLGFQRLTVRELTPLLEICNVSDSNFLILESLGDSLLGVRTLAKVLEHTLGQPVAPHR